MEVHEAITVCYKAGVKVYPDLINGKHYMTVEFNKIKEVEKNPISQKAIAKAHVAKYIEIAKKILIKKNKC